MVDGMSLSLERYMNLLTTRQRLVAANIANADTPGYKTRDLGFQSEFRNALDGGTSASIGKPACLQRMPYDSTSRRISSAANIE
jgi:flagellar basal-body rod protein FlgB